MRDRLNLFLMTALVCIAGCGEDSPAPAPQPPATDSSSLKQTSPPPKGPVVSITRADFEKMIAADDFERKLVPTEVTVTTFEEQAQTPHKATIQLPENPEFDTLIDWQVKVDAGNEFGLMISPQVEKIDAYKKNLDLFGYKFLIEEDEFILARKRDNCHFILLQEFAGKKVLIMSTNFNMEGKKHVTLKDCALMIKSARTLKPRE